MPLARQLPITTAQKKPLQPHRGQWLEWFSLQLLYGQLSSQHTQSARNYGKRPCFFSHKSQKQWLSKTRLLHPPPSCSFSNSTMSILLHNGKRKNAQNRVRNDNGISLHCYYRVDRTFTEEGEGQKILDNQSFLSINVVLARLQLGQALPSIDVDNPPVWDGNNRPFTSVLASRNFVMAYPVAPPPGQRTLVQKLSLNTFSRVMGDWNRETRGINDRAFEDRGDLTEAVVACDLAVGPSQIGKCGG